MSAAAAGPSPIGSAAAIPGWIVRATRATQMAAIAEGEAARAVAVGEVTALAEAISACASAGKVQHFDLPQHRFFRAVLVCIPHQFGIT